MPLTATTVKQYREQSADLSHIRIGTGYDGLLFLDGQTFVACLSCNTVLKIIQALVVAPQYRRRGLGQTLLAMARDRFGCRELSVRKTNSSAIALYKKNGYKTYDERGPMLFMRSESSSEITGWQHQFFNLLANYCCEHLGEYVPSGNRVIVAGGRNCHAETGAGIARSIRAGSGSNLILVFGTERNPPPNGGKTVAHSMLVDNKYKTVANYFGGRDLERDHYDAQTQTYVSYLLGGAKTQMEGLPLIYTKTVKEFVEQYLSKI